MLQVMKPTLRGESTINQIDCRYYIPGLDTELDKDEEWE